jgi:hypothetical protein
MAIQALAEVSWEEFAIEAMKGALSGPEDSVRAEAKAALSRVAPEVLTNGVAK